MAVKGLEILLQKKIGRVGRVHDYLQLHFDGGIIVNIFNRYCFVPEECGDLSRLLGASVVEHRRSDEFELLKFSEGSALKIGLSDGDYIGPEAIEIIESDGTRIVW